MFVRAQQELRADSYVSRHFEYLPACGPATPRLPGRVDATHILSEHTVVIVGLLAEHDPASLVQQLQPPCPVASAHPSSPSQED